MAECLIETKFFCEICQLGFRFASKYRMHLSRSRHRALEEIVSMSQAGTATAATTRTSAYDVEHTPGIHTKRDLFCVLFYYLIFSILFVSAYKFKRIHGLHNMPLFTNKNNYFHNYSNMNTVYILPLQNHYIPVSASERAPTYGSCRL